MIMASLVLNMSWFSHALLILQQRGSFVKGNRLNLGTMNQLSSNLILK